MLRVLSLSYFLYDVHTGIPALFRDKMPILQQLSAISFESQSETVFIAQSADMEIILERLVLIFQSDSLGDFHGKVVIDMKRPYSVFARFPVMFARTENEA